MKKIIVLFVMLITVNTLYSDQLDTELERIESLEEERQYLTAVTSAYDLREKYDDPRIIYRITHISINNFGSSLNHKLFGFKNLTEDEDIYEVRRNGGEFTMVYGDLEALLKESAEKFPDSPVIYEAVADYYLDLKMRYGDQLEYSIQDLDGFILEHYMQAYELGSRKEKVISNIGEYSMRKGDLEKGISFYRQAIKMDSENPTYNYNLGYALGRLGRFDEALPYSEKSMLLYTNPDFKADALMMYGHQNLKIGQDERAKVSLLKALELKPALWHASNYLIAILLKQNNDVEAKEKTEESIKLNKRNFNALSSFLSTYRNHNKDNLFREILNELIEYYNESELDQGTMHYYLALSYIDTDGLKARSEFEAAIEIFTSELGSDHPILENIENYLNTL
jgi:tetratricopeptide (TPR) repeat protein